MRKIDVFPHILPRGFYDRLVKIAPPGLLNMKRVMNIPVISDLDLRLRIMDAYEGYQQVLTLAAPPIEAIAGPDLTPELARIANDEMAAIVEKHPDRFPAFVASLAMNQPDAAVDEIDRAVNDLGATGVQIFTNVNGLPLDRPEFQPIFDRMAEIGLPIWVHPTRTAAMADYPDEARSKYDIWWAFGWPYETSAAMARLVFSGLLDRHPSLTIITHHLGGMIPYFEGRVGPGLDQLGNRSDDPDDGQALRRLAKRPVDYFHMLYGDTAVFGSTAATECGVAFFGADRVLFGTDMPFDPEKGHGFIRGTIAALENARLSDAERQKIYEGNALRLLRLKGAAQPAAGGARVGG